MRAQALAVVQSLPQLPLFGQPALEQRKQFPTKNQIIDDAAASSSSER